ncbi:hypothetical protein DYH09_12435 [bacterium CPR1]|nr:hypothetical protein [bacterium CPR1]
MNGVLGGAGLLVGLFVIVRFVLPRMAARANARSLLFIYETCASALRGAGLELLSMEPMEEPPEGQAQGPWVRLRLRIAPRECKKDGHRKWEPTELALIPAEQVRGRQLSVAQVEESAGPHEVRLVEWERELQDPDNSPSTRTFRSANSGEQIPRKIVGPGVVEMVVCLPRRHQKMRLHYCHVLVGPTLELVGGSPEPEPLAAAL